MWLCYMLFCGYVAMVSCDVICCFVVMLFWYHVDMLLRRYTVKMPCIFAVMWLCCFMLLLLHGDGVTWLCYMLFCSYVVISCCGGLILSFVTLFGGKNIVMHFAMSFLCCHMLL